LGVAAAAFALGLEFIPVASESYELVIPMVYANSPLLEPIYRIMSDLNFRRSIGKIPGYDTTRMGTVTYEGTP
jgi:putative molybdopterin biosynthesis protein